MIDHGMHPQGMNCQDPTGSTTQTNRSRSIALSLAASLAVTVLSALSVEPTNAAMHWLKEAWRHGEADLAKGTALRLAAIEQQTPEKHAEANMAFSRSEAAGIAEATAFLGQAYCFGWAVPTDARRGQGMIDDAIRRDPRLMAKWGSHNPGVCPQQTPPAPRLPGPDGG